MNEKVENLIKKEKDRLYTSKKQMRDNHLISLGLIDENKTERKYMDTNYSAGYSTGYGKFDPETKKYYTESHAALDVTDEEYDEICKYHPPTLSQTDIFKNTTGAEVTLNTISIIVLVCGIIGTLICLFTITFVEECRGCGKEFSPIGFVISLGVLLTSLTTWATLKIICEIAMNLRQINNKTK